MRRIACSVVLLSALLCTPALWADGNRAHLRYDVDPATAVPSATVIKNSEGITVVIFKVPAIRAGDTFVFRADMLCRSGKGPYPVTATVYTQSNSKAAATADPPSVTLTGPDTPASALVTVTVQPSGDGASKLKAHVKADPPPGSHMGIGAGIKVVIVKGTATAWVQPEEQMLLDVLDALEPEAPPRDDRP